MVEERGRERGGRNKNPPNTHESHSGQHQHRESSEQGPGLGPHTQSRTQAHTGTHTVTHTRAHTHTSSFRFASSLNAACSSSMRAWARFRSSSRTAICSSILARPATNASR